MERLFIATTLVTVNWQICSIGCYLFGKCYQADRAAIVRYVNKNELVDNIGLATNRAKGKNWDFQA